jgi:hypothetical protein
MAGGKLSARNLNIAVRRSQALSLRRQGGTWRDVADTLRATLETDEPVPGVTESYDAALAYRDVLAEIKRVAAENRPLAEFERDEQLEQLRELWQKFYAMAIERGDYLAFDRCVTIQERRMKLLGMEAPQKIALTDPTGLKEYGAGLTADERIAILRELFGSTASGQAEAGGAGAQPAAAPGLPGLAADGDA